MTGEGIIHIKIDAMHFYYHTSLALYLPLAWIAHIMFPPRMMHLHEQF